MKSQIMTLGSTLVILGIVFGEDRLIGYLFIGAGVLLSIVNAFFSRKNLKKKNYRTGGV